MSTARSELLGVLATVKSQAWKRSLRLRPTLARVWNIRSKPIRRRSSERSDVWSWSRIALNAADALMMRPLSSRMRPSPTM